MSPFSYITVLMSKFVRHVMLHVMLGRWRARPVYLRRLCVHSFHQDNAMMDAVLSMTGAC